MKTNISQNKLDFQKLDLIITNLEEMPNYLGKNYYLIMNQHTFDELAREREIKTNIEHPSIFKEIHTPCYRRLVIIICPTFDFGDIDIASSCD